MKNFLFILTLLFGILLFIPEDRLKSDDVMAIAHQQEAVMKEKAAADLQHSLEVLSSDLKGSTCLTPRRTIQASTSTFNIRLFKCEEKTLQYFRLKEINQLRKVSESVSTCQTINVSTLLCRMGYHIYALRKIII